tara:strand:+ start:160 stop:453 length:294 start_codon:yes stop_codon:yes gene_type:complete
MTLLDELFGPDGQGQVVDVNIPPERKESIKNNAPNGGNDDFLLMFDDAPAVNQNGDPQSISPPPDHQEIPTTNEHGDDFADHNYDQNYGNEIQIYEA